MNSENDILIHPLVAPQITLCITLCHNLLLILQMCLLLCSAPKYVFKILEFHCKYV